MFAKAEIKIAGDRNFLSPIVLFCCLGRKSMRQNHAGHLNDSIYNSLYLRCDLYSGLLKHLPGEFLGLGITLFARQISSKPGLLCELCCVNGSVEDCMITFRVFEGTSLYRASITAVSATTTGLDITTILSRSVPVQRL